MTVLTRRAVVSVIGATLIMISVGSLYTFGSLTPYIASYLHYHLEPNIQIIQLNIINPISYSCMPVGMITGSYLATKFDIRLIMMVSFSIYGLVLLGLSYTDHLVGWILGYGIGVGFCQGVPYMLPINNSYKYFPGKKGLISGICIGGLGFGAVIFNQLIFALINPNNQPIDQDHHFSQEVADNLPFTLRILGCVYFGLVLLGCSLMTPFKKQKQDVSIKLPESESQHALIDFNNDCPSMKQALTTQMFYRLIVLIALSSAFGIYIAFNYKQYGLHAINDDAFLTLSGSFGAISNGAARFIWGALFDIVPFKVLLSIIELLLLGLAISFPFVVQIKACFMLYLISIYFAYGGLYAVFPSITYKIYGQLHGAKVYSLLFFGYSLGSIFQYVLHYYLVDKHGTDGHKYSFWIFAGCQALAILIVVVSRWRVEWEKTKQILSSSTDRDPDQ